MKADEKTESFNRVAHRTDPTIIFLSEYCNWNAKNCILSLNSYLIKLFLICVSKNSVWFVFDKINDNVKEIWLLNIIVHVFFKIIYHNLTNNLK